MTQASLEQMARTLRSTVAGKVSTDRPVAGLVSFRVGGPAAIVVEPKDAYDLSRVGKALIAPRPRVLIVGRGTNLLVSDGGFAGVVVRLGKGFEWIRAEGSTLEAGGATPLPQIANRAARLQLSGLEFAIAIPAAVGGAVRMNAGAHGNSISDVLESVLICDLDTGELETVAADELKLGYRESSIRATQVVCSARFRLRTGERKAILKRMKDYRTHRAGTQPAEAPNAGSMFRNPPGDVAGRLIEAAGLKGYRVGEAEVSRKHANFFLAHPGAKAQEIYDLMAHVQKKVFQQFGILLQPEVRIAGSFDTSSNLKVSE